MLFSSRIKVGIRFCDWLVSGYAHVFSLLCVVIVTLRDESAVIVQVTYLVYLRHQ